VCTPPTTCFLGPTRVHTPCSIVISSAICAELKAKSRYTLQQATPFSPLKLPLPMGDLNPHPIHGSLGSPEPQHKRHLDWFNCFCTAHGRASLYFTMGHPLPSKLSLSTGVSGHHLIHGSVDSKRVLNPNGISISCAVLAGLTTVTD